MIPILTPEKLLGRYLLITTWIFLAAFLIGMQLPAPLRKQAVEGYRAVASTYQGHSGVWLFFSILSHNILVSSLVLLSGLLLGIFPILAMATNGLFLGILFRHVGEISGYREAALTVLPQWVIEIPALLIAASYGLWLGVMAIRQIRGKEDTLFRYHIGYSFQRYLKVVLPLLVIAAAIETVLIVI